MPTTSPSGPALTVVIPTWNRADMMTDALESVLGQSFTDFVVLVSDNASTDDTTTVVAAYADPRIRYVRRDQNLGWLGNFNAALAEVTTPLVTILNDDDVMRPGALARATAVLAEHPSVVFVHTALDLMLPDGQLSVAATNWTHGLRVDTIEPGQTFIRRSMRYFGRVCPPSVVMRTAALPPVPFDPEDGAHADHTLHLSMALDGSVAFLATPGMAWRGHDGQDSNALCEFEPDGTQYLRVEPIAAMRDAKLRWIDSHAARLRRVHFLRFQVERFVAYEMVERARAGFSRGRRVAWQRLMEAMRRAPIALVEPRAWRVLARLVMGEHVWSFAKRLLGRGAPDAAPLSSGA
jgi:glycosyltransferase involved in cell wall biosynthesis